MEKKKIRCYISVLEQGKDYFTKYSCNEIREQYDSFLNQFKKCNACNDRDKRFIEYKGQLDEFLNQCDCCGKMLWERRKNRNDL